MGETKIYNIDKDNYSEVEKKVDEWFEYWIKMVKKDG